MAVDNKIELLSPAGSLEVLKAALEAGANAAYLGLKHFNARVGAKNFTPAELAEAVALAHAYGAKIYLTLNTMLSQRELGMAARSLAVAQECKVDGVLITDAAYLLFKDSFPKLDFHFSTQAGISSSAGVRAGKALGMTRVVLARELSAEEIRIATATPEVETEVFIQGALCFSCSGRCLLSSWGGGRSGNRGACASPCRVAWKDANGNEERPMSMHDLCLIEWTEQLKQMGVASLKIEGRLKTADWVSRAVTLYRRALDGKGTLSELRSEATSLGNYTGRELTDGYLSCQRSGMTGESRRLASSAVCSSSFSAEKEQQPIFTLSISEDAAKGTLLSFKYAEAESIHRIPPQRIANERRAITVHSMVESIMEIASRMKICCAPASCSDELFARLLPKNAANQAVDAAAAFLRNAQKEDDGLPRGVKLPPEVDEMLKAKPTPCSANCLTFGSKADRCRINWNEVGTLPAGMVPIICCYPVNADDAKAQIEALRSCGNRAVVSLPLVMYEEQLPHIKQLIGALAAERYLFEVNSWDGLQLLMETAPQVHFECGPGLAVLNSFAARKLFSIGAESVSVSYEVDKLQLEWLCQACEVPLSVTIFSAPPLMMTRTLLPGSYASSSFADARGIELVPAQEGLLTVLRPKQPYDWRKLRNSAVKAAHLVLDLRGPARTAFAEKSNEHDFLFNYDRTLR